MISVLSTNITSPLGFTTEQNYQAVLSGSTALRRYEGMWGLPEPFAASLFSDEQKAALALDGYTFFEALAIRSVHEALSHLRLDVTSERVVFILSTTKGNVEEINSPRYYPSESASIIARNIGLTTTPIVVCNACVSGLSAQLLADHLLSANLYDYAIVVGAEVQSKFIVAGFQSLKAISEEPCRPFDMERNGLNPGEASATIVFGKPSQRLGDVREGLYWNLVDGAACNDACHLVSPSPQGVGLTAAIKTAMKGRDKKQLATICAHGTATLYNDQMESKAIQRTNLSDVPLGIVLATKGFMEPGVSGRVSINGEQRPTDKTAFLKVMSGFGGCNVAALYAKGAGSMEQGAGSMEQGARGKVKLEKVQTVRLSSAEGTSPADIYKQEIGNYPKFYKMDILSRLAFVAAEKALSNSPLKDEDKKPALILFNHSSSIESDRRFLATISRAEDFFPSPSAFVYTLPNIAAGEIAIRHQLLGETSFYILPEKDETLMQQILEATLGGTEARGVVSGWVDAESNTSYECELTIYSVKV